ncbi:hypothetical protein DASC09_036220 [Saccharomycopsis crataegensis]|uniref:Uncharacterized protein n=1 Tax=Saccharomycopsis crataegensis TaxID=43959 RepID=A0AAV5QNB0_9ASCO|nr:hypothetical protein DASC09_036220 [Saccharomycopsis crataegensis]
MKSGYSSSANLINLKKPRAIIKQQQPALLIFKDSNDGGRLRNPAKGRNPSTYLNLSRIK